MVQNNHKQQAFQNTILGPRSGCDFSLRKSNMLETTYAQAKKPAHMSKEIADRQTGKQKPSKKTSHETVHNIAASSQQVCNRHRAPSHQANQKIGKPASQDVLHVWNKCFEK